MAKSKHRQTGPTLILPEVKPWHEPVSMADVLLEATALVQRYMVLSDHQTLAVALWCVHAHAHDSFGISPRLAIISPEKQCGKTTLLSMVADFVPRPLPCANITAPSVFRSVEAFHPTLLIDEADTFLAEHEELRGILNSGHNRRSAHVVRLVGERHDPKVFTTWAPVAIAAIKGIPDTLMDRSVVIRLRRKRLDEKVERLRLDRMDAFQQIARKMARVAHDNADDLRQADPDVPENLSDRAQDNWRPLLALADLAGDDWGEKARLAALDLCAPSDEDDGSPGVMLLEDISDIMLSKRVERISSHELVEELRRLEDRPWAEWMRGSPITAHSVARLLKPFGIRPRKFRFPTPLNGYERNVIEDAVVRYGTKANASIGAGTSEQPSNISYFDERRTGTDDVAPGTAGTSKPLPHKDCSDVPIAERYEEEF